MSRKVLKKKIVERILSNDFLLNENFNYDKITTIFRKSELEILEFLASHLLIQNTASCRFCTFEMYLVKDKSCIDGYVWCCSDVCKKKQSVRKNSVFYGLKKSFFTYFKFFYLWAKEENLCNIAHELNINVKTATDIAFFIREIIMNFYDVENFSLGGIDSNGESIVVEIDESVFFRRKYNVGRLRNTQWVLGMIERISGRCLMVRVPDRSSNTLIPIIEQFILPGSTIITDCWPSYNQLGVNEMFTHLSVNHSLNFISPEDSEINTQKIENCWMLVKKKIKKMHGTHSNFLDGYLIEFCFRKQFSKKKVFNNLLLLFKKVILERN